MKSRILVSLTLVTVIGFSATSFAEGGHWGKHHPRREQVNDRLARQNHRINKEVKEGEMSKSEAAQLHKNDKKIRQEERDMSSQNNGHITKQEQKTLNQQENANSKEIGK